ncbi:MAG: hypothetical protein ACREQ4_15485, partial [Candidatus Binataceae bacterium]
ILQRTIDLDFVKDTKVHIRPLVDAMSSRPLWSFRINSKRRRMRNRGAKRVATRRISCAARKFHQTMPEWPPSSFVSASEN